jgi:Rieske Fe-S protein
MSDHKANKNLSENSSCEGDISRRLVITSTIGISAACALFPFAAGLTSIIDPVIRNSGSTTKVPWTKVTSVVNLPVDGKPAKFEIILAEVKDAWTTYKNVPAGAVYLSRKGDEVIAFNLKCPHLGCAVDYRSKTNDYFCPCHNSTFGLDGSVTDADSPSPRGLDTMHTKIEDEFVWIRFQQYRPNIADKIPLS